ncbi:MAG: hypothetical protein ACI4RA_05170 [Kiritimatiellia bacterium]
MSRNAVVKVVLPLCLLVVLALAAGVVGWAWSNRDTSETRRAARKEVSKELQACAPEAVLPYLETLATSTSCHTWFTTCSEGESSPWCFWTLRCGRLPRVPYDYIGQLTEDQFIRFAGDGGAKSADAARLKELLAFSDRLLKMNVLSADAANALKERRLDGFFLSGDFDGAIAYLEGEGVPNRSPAWCKGTAAKLRAHKAMEAGDKKEAVKQLLAFGAFMQSDEQKDFEDCDPTTGIVYSREWVVARNFMRCSKMSREIGDAANAEAYLAKAKENFAIALDKAKDDKKSLEALQAELKADNLSVKPATPPATPSPAATPAAK